MAARKKRPEPTENPPSMEETHCIGPDTHQRIVRATDCPALAGFHIKHVGLADAASPYRMVRTDLSGAYLMATLEGRGRVLLDGRWQDCKPGTACLAPPHALHAFQAIPKSRWEFCWVRYLQPEGQKPVIHSMSPVMARFDARPLRDAISGLWHEMEGPGDPRSLHHWVELIQTYVTRFAQPWHLDDRLWRLWEAVSADPGREWTLDELARRSHFSAEHLRRLCRQEIGRSPMQHVTWLRMRQAAQRLETSNDTIEAIAGEVGYQNPYVFSNTFKKWTGWRPSVYRELKPGAA